MDGYLSEKELKRRRLIVRVKLYAAVSGLVLLLFGGVMLLRSPFFQVKNIEINGLKSFTKEEFISNIKTASHNEFMAAVLGGDNYLLWFEKVRYDNPAIVNMTIKRDFWNRKLIFNVDERKPYGIWCFETCYWFDEKGVLFKEAPQTEGSLIYKITDSGAKTDAQPFKFENVMKTLGILKERQIPVRNIKIDEKLQELSLQSYEGAAMVFSLRFDPTATLISALDTVVKKLGFKNIKYLDLTVENRIYYK